MARVVGSRVTSSGLEGNLAGGSLRVCRKKRGGIPPRSPREAESSGSSLELVGGLAAEGGHKKTLPTPLESARFWEGGPLGDRGRPGHL